MRRWQTGAFIRRRFSQKRTGYFLEKDAKRKNKENKKMIVDKKKG